jgi:AAA domain
MISKQFEELIRFWRSIEALSPQDPPKLSPQDKQPVVDWKDRALPPWLHPAHLNRYIEPTKMWRYSIYLGLFNKQTFASLLEEKLGKSDVYEERVNGKCCLLAISVDELGKPIPESLVLSMPGWTIGAILEGGLEELDVQGTPNSKGFGSRKAQSPTLQTSDSGYARFDAIQNDLREELALRTGQLEAGVAVDFDWLTDFTSYAVRKCQIFDLFEGTPTHRIKCAVIQRPKPDAIKTTNPKVEDELLNSFFIKDLNKVLASGLHGSSHALIQYVSQSHAFTKWDVRTHLDKAFAELTPAAFPRGTWPSAHPLAFSQQMAVNAIWSRLSEAPGLFAVNGPPGTGKTTLLRDLVAGVIVKRAEVLKGLKHPFGSKKTVDIGSKTIPYFPLNESLLGHLIVVASSNNGAVENISLELPRVDSIDPMWQGKTDFWRDIGSAIISDDAWGLLAGKLGNKKNRNDFASHLFWSKGDDEQAIGLRVHLEAIVKKVQKPQLHWLMAVKQFETAQLNETMLRDALSAAANRPQALAALETQYATLQLEDSRLQSKLQMLEDSKVSANDQRSKLKASRAAIELDLQRIIATKPGILEWISTFGGAHRHWRAKLNASEIQFDASKVAEDQAIQVREAVVGKLQRTVSQIKTLSAELLTADRNVEQTRAAQYQDKLRFGDYLPTADATDEEREKSSPWSHPDWRQARIVLFLAALDLHRSFVETNASKMLVNLSLAMDVLGGSVADPDARQHAFDSLGLVCPVISTTFASTSSLFGNMGAESIGWLLIDEAGQAAPQAAVGAIWRAKRVVVVGDPLQLEPVVNVPRMVEVSSAKYYGDVDAWWHPSRTSVQTLADNATCLGTTMSTSGNDIWVGAPLRVHRRCDEPMFSISNEIAYDGLMVHGKSPTSSTLPSSSWRNVPSTEQDAQGNWIPAEGKILEDLIQDLVINHPDIQHQLYLVSPFRDVVAQLRTIGKTNGLDAQRIGTIHTTQGKEADAVIVVLGGGSAGARDWAASKPNLLNVAATRAKTRLYVIGDRSEWSKRRYFDVASSMLG